MFRLGDRRCLFYLNTKMPKLYNKEFNYFDSNKFLTSRRTERRIEVGLGHSILSWANNLGYTVVEFGNVLTKFTSNANHDVVDIIDGPIKKDFEFFKIDKKYDLLISISSLEHMGKDIFKEEGVEKTIRVMNHIIEISDRCLVTVPLKWNLEFDKLLYDNKTPFQWTVMKRTSNITWEETTLSEARYSSREYNAPYKWANDVAIGHYNINNFLEILDE